MSVPSLEERLEGLECLESELIAALDRERINFSDRKNWKLLPKATGGKNEVTRSWKYAWSNKIIQYFRSIGAPLSKEFAGNLYGKLNKDVMKKVVYGILSFPDIPARVYESLTNWEKLCLAAGAYSRGKANDLRDRPIAEVVRTYIKRGIDYLHRTHATKKSRGEYNTLLKIPGSQRYRKIERADDTEHNELAAQFATLLRAERRSGADASERAGIFLDGCTDAQLRSLTQRFGAASLGGYAVPAPEGPKKAPF